MNNLPQKNKYMKRYQSGIKYRSICEECNNVILGENDKIYQLFTREIIKHLESGILLNKIAIPVKINRLCRALVGHALAAKESFEPEVIPDQIMREYVLDKSKKLDELKLYVWIYPYKSIIVTRDFVVRGYSSGTFPTGMISAAIMSYPLAYIVSDGESDCGLDDIGILTTEGIEDEVDVVLHMDTMLLNGTQDYKPFNWPVNVGDDKKNSAIMVLGAGSFVEDSRVGIKE